jgi:hypothetical protein
MIPFAFTARRRPRAVLPIVAQIFVIGTLGGVLVVGLFGTFPFNRVVIM